MNSLGGPEPSPGDSLVVQSRSALLDALEALADQRDAVIVIGAQAIYLRTPDAPVALAETTKDSDLALDPRALNDDPLIEEAMTAAGFVLNPTTTQPGAWQTPQGIPVDLMVREALAGPGNAQTRGARLPPHHKRAMRRARGLEAALVDNSVEPVAALDPNDRRTFHVKIAGPAALVVAKIHKLTERLQTPDRLNDKDAHDVDRILRSIATAELTTGLDRLLADHISRAATQFAIDSLQDHLAAGPHAAISSMAGRAEEGIGDPDTVALAASLLAADVLAQLAE